LVGEQSAEQQQEFTMLFVVFDISNSYVLPNVGLKKRYGVDCSSSYENLVSQWDYLRVIYMAQEFFLRASAEVWTFCYYKSRHTTMGVFHIIKSCLQIIKNTGCTCALH